MFTADYGWFELYQVTNTIKSLQVRRRDLQDNLDDDYDSPNHLSPNAHSASRVLLF
jgi:hypothetical protein